MHPHHPNHLTADELDACLTESSSQLVTSHLATCPACAAMVDADARLVAVLAALPYFDRCPASQAGSCRTSARRAQVAAVPAPATSGRALAARRRAIGAALLAGGGIAAGFVWAAAHPADALRWSTPALQNAGHTLWLSLQAVVANTTEQPWFASVRDTLATPSRALLVFAGVAGAYAIGLTGLRRLMTEPATHASW